MSKRGFSAATTDQAPGAPAVLPAAIEREIAELARHAAPALKIAAPHTRLEIERAAKLFLDLALSNRAERRDLARRWRAR